MKNLFSEFGLENRFFLKVSPMNLKTIIIHGQSGFLTQNSSYKQECHTDLMNSRKLRVGLEGNCSQIQ